MAGFYGEKMKKLIIITLLLLTAAFLFAGTEPARKALVVGNSAYQAGSLTNPENDAESMAEVLKSAGFEVILTTNRNLRQMESDLRSFRQSINKGDVALFFYAGHGVQVDGQNYLLPVDNKGIANNSELKRRAIDAQDYVNAMADSGASLNIIMLDACRDNPLPSASRSGSRGLAVMSAPRDSETVIVYATKANDVAQDGRGSNSTFTTAFLELVNTPDLDLLTFFNNVGTKVKQDTSGKQIPTIYTEPLSRSFSFFSSSKLAEEARQASAIAMAELESMEAKIRALKEQAENARNNDEKQKIELERKRQEALLAAQRLQAENLAADADRRAEDAARAETEAKQRAMDSANASARQDELAKLAAKRREELEKLSEDAESEDPDVLISTIERLKTVLEEIEAEYSKAWQSTQKEIHSSFQVRLNTLKKQKAEIWETDDDFTTRIRNETEALLKEQDQLTTERKVVSETLLNTQTATIRTQLQDALSIFDTRTWTLSGSEVDLEIGEYDRNNQIWLFTLKSNNKEFPIWPISLSVDLSQAGQDKIIALNEAVKSNSVVGIIEWSIKPIEDNYGVFYEGSHLVNIIENREIISDTANDTKLIATFTSESRQKLQIAWTGLEIFWNDNVKSVVVNGKSIIEQGTVVISNNNIFEIDKKSKLDPYWYQQNKKNTWGNILKIELKVPKAQKDLYLTVIPSLEIEVFGSIDEFSSESNDTYIEGTGGILFPFGIDLYYTEYLTEEIFSPFWGLECVPVLIDGLNPTNQFLLGFIITSGYGYIADDAKISAEVGGAFNLTNDHKVLGMIRADIGIEGFKIGMSVYTNLTSVFAIGFYFGLDLFIKPELFGIPLKGRYQRSENPRN